MIRPDAFPLPQAVQGIEMDGSPFIEPYSWRGFIVDFCCHVWSPEGSGYSWLGEHLPNLFHPRIAWKSNNAPNNNWKKNRLLTAKTQAVFDEGCLEKAGLKHKPGSLPEWTMIISKYSLGSMPRELIINQHQLSFATAQLLQKNWKVLRSLAV